MKVGSATPGNDDNTRPVTNGDETRPVPTAADEAPAQRASSALRGPGSLGR